jgi:hypothetical protein
MSGHAWAAASRAGQARAAAVRGGGHVVVSRSGDSRRVAAGGFEQDQKSRGEEHRQ